jgi:hypothetical protein
MTRSKRRHYKDEVNPYIAFADLCVSLVLILVVLLAVGQLGRADDRYVKAQREFELAVKNMPQEVRPEKVNRNDPPGAQRWAYLGRGLFTKDNSLSPSGRIVLEQFAKLLKEHPRWKRVRIEGHAMPSKVGQPDDWASSAAVAAAAAELFQVKANIQPWRLAVSGRGGQTPYYKVFINGLGSPEGKAIASKMNSLGVRYSNGAPDMPAGLEIEKNFGDRQQGTFDMDAYGRNLRIEIVVEFLSTQSN